MRHYLLLLILAIQTEANCQLNTIASNNRLLVVSGGGERGAWGAGYAKRLSDSFGPYRVAFGTSTGSLMIPLIVLNKFDDLQRAYTTVTQKDIFNVNPFNKKTGELNFLAFLRVVFGCQTFGKSENLRKKIDDFISDPLYKEIQDQKLVFGVQVVNFKDGSTTTKMSSDIHDATEMKNWIWASANEPLFMSYYNDHSKDSYVDGGVRETIPLMEALNYAVSHDIHDIDAIINKPRYPVVNKDFKPKSIFKGLVRLIELWETEVLDDDILISLLTAQNESCHPDDKDVINIHLHYFPSAIFTGIHEKELLFDEGRMNDLWKRGVQGEEDSQETFLKPANIVLSLAKAKNILLNYRQRFHAQ